MASLTISVNSGSGERLSKKEAILTTSISQRVLSLFFLCEPEDLDQIAKDNNIEQEIKYRGDKKTPAIFYNVGQIPELLDGLRKQVIDSGEIEGKNWLLDLDTKQAHFELVLPSGTKMYFSKD